ncbi:hypothetical protein PST407_04400 [Pseudomonas syringae pv. tomato]|uniref:Uncharacterized protein n=1 Tax=Pseudomonas syringae pv. tomato TaxID=323 RepID=A0AAV1BT16_PSEUB|nr:hypothetical protein PSTA9_03889 [Pseudomonas syringae pv. tomato]KUR44012.1 hypothetical protein PST407_04400 [Pseudomonas syringae pv. tomato]CAI8961328.1 hypothetical protein DAPPPG215_23800 [Pseudomonas syringae pv. tomato]
MSVLPAVTAGWFLNGTINMFCKTYGGLACQTELLPSEKALKL